jgi:hypothetical protein
MGVVKIRAVVLGTEVEAVNTVGRRGTHPIEAPKMDSIRKELPAMLQELLHHRRSHVFIRPESTTF